MRPGYLEGRDLPPEKELLEHIPVEMFDTAQHIASRGPFLVAKEILPAMRKRGAGSFFFSNNASSLRGRKRMTGQSLYYPRVMMRTLAQVLTEEYSEHGVHVANVVIDGTIVDGENVDVPLFDVHMSGGRTIADAIDTLAGDGRIRAIVLRIDSPPVNALDAAVREALAAALRPLAAAAGVWGVRVHEVRGTVDALAVWRASGSPRLAAAMDRTLRLTHGHLEVL